MSITKREINIYKAHGIIVDGGKLITPAGLKMTPPLQKGNTKTGAAVWTWSTVPGNGHIVTSYGPVAGTCKCNCPGCYAMAGKYNCAEVRDALGVRTLTAEAFPVWIMEAITAQLEYIVEKAAGPVWVRISAAGDVTDTMAPVWREIVRRFPSVTFWTYTKNDAFRHAFDDVDNANIVDSIIPGYGLNYGTIAHVLRAYVHIVDNGGAPYICRCGIDPDQHCAGCAGCSEHKHVLFIEHGTKYNAKKDPLYTFAVDIINRQATATPAEIAAAIRAGLEA